MSRVLIFDDDADILELCSLILQLKGFETIAEKDSRQVIERILETNPDVIMMDNWIPGMGGVEATLLIKATEKTAHIPVIFFSANNNIEELAASARADYSLKKPFDIAELNDTVCKAAQSRKDITISLQQAG
jgi:two-component system alkaline phosphatase synthesis response regulator PhoP